jgi:hypothetical protein
MLTPPFKTADRVMMVFAPYPNKPVTKILGYGDAMHFVSGVFNSSHIAVLYYNIACGSVTVFDGLIMTIKSDSNKSFTLSRHMDCSCQTLNAAVSFGRTSVMMNMGGPIGIWCWRFDSMLI